MALVFCDGFDSYAATADLTKKWALAESPWTWNSTAGRGGGGAAQAATTGGKKLRSRSVFTSQSKCAMGFWMKCSGVPASESDLCLIYDSGGTLIGGLRIQTTGALKITQWNNSALITGTINVCDNAWHWVEALTPSGLGGLSTVTLTVDTIQEGTTTSGLRSDHSPSFFNFVSIASQTLTIDDVIIYDDSGTSFQVSDYPLGARQITTLRPSAESAVQFTPSTGLDNAALIDEVNADTSDYVESGTSGDQDLYTYGDLGFTPSEINAVMLNAHVANPNPGTINYQQIAKSGATQTDGTSTAAPNAPLTQQQPFYVDPNTAAAWTGAGVDAATFGIKVA